MTTSLRATLIGAWQLESFVFEPLDGSPSILPLGLAPLGLLMYSESGFMSAQLSGGARPDMASEDWSRASLDKYVALASSYIAYGGPFEVDENSHIVTHFVELSLISTWVGIPQLRQARLEQGWLLLSTVQPLLLNEKQGHAHLRWRRAQLS